ncbi:MAG TPA: cyclic nucleotide-binding domain-containing protein, partial [Chloroflexota bacterium]
MNTDGEGVAWDPGLGFPDMQGRSALLDALPEHEMEQVEHRLSPVSCKAGSDLVTQGSWHGTMYVLRAGAMAVQVRTVDGQIRQLARLVPGDCIGEMSMLMRSPASATVTAVVDSELWALGSAEFLELLATCPTLARNMAMILSRRLSLTNVARDSSTIQWMRLSVHPDLPPDLPEAVARAVAYHLAIPLLVLDSRENQCWQSGEVVPSLQTALTDHRIARRLHAMEAGVVAVPTDTLTEDAAGHLHEWLYAHVTHILTLDTIGRRVQKPVYDLEHPSKEVTL